MHIHPRGSLSPDSIRFVTYATYLPTLLSDANKTKERSLGLAALATGHVVPEHVVHVP